MADKTDRLAGLKEWEERDAAIFLAGDIVQDMTHLRFARAAGECAKAVIASYLNATGREAEAEIVAAHILRFSL